MGARGVQVADAVRAAIADGSGSLGARLARKACHALLVEHRTLLVWAVWLAVGVVWGVAHQGWDVLTSLYSSISVTSQSHATHALIACE